MGALLPSACWTNRYISRKKINSRLAFEQLGDNGQPGGMVKDHEPVMQLPFYLYPPLIDIDDGAFDMGDEKNRDLWLETQTHPQHTA